jgi:hypothetical protein
MSSSLNCSTLSWGNRLQFLKNNLQHELQNLNLITLYVWVGTCNFTRKEGHFIYLVSKDNSTVDNLITFLVDVENNFGDLAL